MSHFVVTGATGGSTSGATAPNRREINDLIKDEVQFSLYIQALQSIYSGKSQNDVDSFFQIAAIHGLPYVPWNGSGQQPVDRNGWEGYCTHGDVLFPTFHRPYVFLIEQVLQAAAIKIASTYTVNAQQFQDAAQNLRQPYWDWAANSTPPSQVISDDQVTIITSDGSRKSVPNPLRRYTFNPIDRSFPRPYSLWKTTYRYPTSTTSQTPRENITALRNALRSSQTQFKTKTYNLLTRVHTWPAFSNHTVGDGGSSSNSLEAIHDDIHVAVGANGHMSDPAVAAFDPIFFLHHCQVDRLLSLWSALNPGVWVTPSTSENGTFTLRADTPVNKDSDLTPFWNTQNTYWTSSNVIDTASLGYTYPEFNNLNMGDTSAVQTAIGRIVNQLYGGPIVNTLPPTLQRQFVNLAAAEPEKVEKPQNGSALASSFVSFAAVNTGDNKAPVPASGNGEAKQVPLGSETRSRGFAPSHGNGDDASPDLTQAPVDIEASQDMWDWTARIRVKKYGIGCSFAVPLFLGEAPSNPDDWFTADNFVGAHHAFVNGSVDRCANCRERQDLVIEGFVHLDDAIVRLSGLNSLDPSVVEPYLREQLHWKVTKASGEPVDFETIPSLEVIVFATRLVLPPGSMFPVPEETRQCDEITLGRPCGARQA